MEEKLCPEIEQCSWERFQEMVTKKEEESYRKKKLKILNVPMNLSDREKGQLRKKVYFWN